jgi:hypothetical protein
LNFNDLWPKLHADDEKYVMKVSESVSDFAIPSSLPDLRHDVGDEARDGDAGGFHFGNLGCGDVVFAADNGAGVAHAFGGRPREAVHEPDNSSPLK